MEIDAYSAEKRVFRIDDECYIIYLGSHLDDYRPFLRIGNSRQLTKEIIDNIYNIVITESFTGNPVLEPRNVNTEELENIRYVGDKPTVERFLDFLKHYKIETEYISYDKEIETHDHNAVLYIYDNGNVTLLYDKDRLFDLKDRERKDLHFVELTRWIKDQFVKNPLRYLREDFNKPGFFIIKDCILLFDREGCVSFGLPAHYFHSLVGSGIDPDLISAVVTDEASPDFINLCKRKKCTKEHLYILSADNGSIKSAVKLFETSKTGSLKYSLEKVSGAAEKKLYGYRIKGGDSGYHITHTDIPFPLLLGSAEVVNKSTCIHLDPQKGISIGPAKRGTTFPTSEGVPYTFLTEVPNVSDLLKDYLSEFVEVLEDYFTPEESILVRHVNEFVDDILAHGNIQESAGKLKKGIKTLKTSRGGLFSYLLNNMQVMCKYLEKEENSPVKKDLETLASTINKCIGSHLTEVQGFPLIGDCYITSETFYIFYRLSKKTLRSEDYTLAKDFVTSVHNLSVSNLAFYSDEISRLSQLIRELAVVPSARKPKPMPEPVATAPRPGVTIPVHEKPSMAKKEKKVLWKVLPIIAGVVVILGVLFFLPPLSLYKKTVGERMEKKILVSTHKEEVSSVPMEKEKVEEEAAVVLTEREEDIEPQEKAPSYEIEDQEVETRIIITEQKELEEFLSLGYIQITILDVYKLTNKIALSNGYRALDSPEDLKLGMDPDWIYPGNLFTLPDDRQYTVVKDDTIWYIAKRFIKRNLDRDWARYQEILKEIERTDITQNKKNELIVELKSLKEGSYSENFIKEIDKTLKKLQ